MSFLTSVAAMIGGATVGAVVTAPMTDEHSTTKDLYVANAVNCIVSTVVAICLDSYLQKRFDN